MEHALDGVRIALAYALANMPDVLLGLLALGMLGLVRSLANGWRMRRRFEKLQLQLDEVRARLEALETIQARRVLSDIRSAAPGKPVPLQDLSA